ncbi:unnamed protein product [Bemisia tabaci]|uniref:RdRp catalytic domain-containing protein n=1 Tax=Bemisia tabaci TaxID=7038 RepID=A0A9P0ADF6_BEMTA|nr:unnamed protein product [Bemisia tabaci]
MISKLNLSTGFGQRHFNLVGPSRFFEALNLHQDLDLHRSKVTLPSIRKDLHEFVNLTEKPRSASLKAAINKTAQAFSIPQVKMLHLNEVFNYDLPVWGSSPGLPYREMGYKTKQQVVACPENRIAIRRFWHEVKYDAPPRSSDCLAFVRSHLAPHGIDKVRAVWGYPMNMVMGEAVFAIPLIEAFKLGTTPLAYGYETTQGGFVKLKNETAGMSNYIGIDFSKFDKTVPPWLIHKAFNILRRNIDFGNYRNYGVANAERNWKMFDYIENYFIKTPIRLSNGERYLKHCGIASGSYFTQLIGSIVNHILITSYFIHKFGRPPRYLKVLGDDSFLADDQVIDFYDCAKFFSANSIYTPFKLGN